MPTWHRSTDVQPFISWQLPGPELQTIATSATKANVDTLVPAETQAAKLLSHMLLHLDYDPSLPEFHLNSFRVPKLNVIGVPPLLSSIFLPLQSFRKIFHHSWILVNV
ncbi:hypothetical protein JHK85_032380 [Glycine max]|nr:hypothetical protein JHK85_032380 [Glycine max]